MQLPMARFLHLHTRLCMLHLVVCILFRMHSVADAAAPLHTGSVPWSPVPWSATQNHGTGGLFKGDYHRLSAITAYNCGTGPDDPSDRDALQLAAGAERPNREGFPIDENQNNFTTVESCALVSINTSSHHGGTVPGQQSKNVIGLTSAQWKLRRAPSSDVEPRLWDPRPAPGSPLCGAGVGGSDIGAFACSDDPAEAMWRPGCSLSGCTSWS
jgi:hypothetical protein